MIREFETIRSSISSERGKSHSVRSMSSETSNNLVRPSSSNFPTVTELDQINGDNRSKYAKLRRNVSRGSSIKDNHPVVKFDRRHRRNKFALQDKKRKLGSYSKNHSRSRSEKRERYRSRSPSRRRDVRSTSTGNSYFRRNPHFSDLPLEWWEREEDCKIAKEVHTEKLDRFWPSREDLVMQTTLADEDTVLEPNMFPYATPAGISHYTLWSVRDMTHTDIIKFVDEWLLKHHPQVRRWQYDDNSGERSILLFHVHVFVEMDPFSFTPRPGLEYFPPHIDH